MLEGMSLRDCFPVIVAAEDVTVGKPDPPGYLLTAKLVSEKVKNRVLKPADCLIVEDAPTVSIRPRRRVSGAGGGHELPAGKTVGRELRRQNAEARRGEEEGPAVEAERVSSGD